MKVVLEEEVENGHPGKLTLFELQLVNPQAKIRKKRKRRQTVLSTFLVE